MTEPRNLSEDVEADISDETTEPRIYVGCAGLPVTRPAYKKVLSAVELRNTYVQPPKPRTAAQWRAELGPDCAVVFCAWQLVCGELTDNVWRGLARPIEPALAGRYGAFRDTEEVAAAWATTAASAAAFESRAILFAAPPSFSPTPEHKAAMRSFFQRTERDGRTFVLELGGVWEAEDQLAIAAECGVVLATDPLNEDSPQPEGPIGYFRMRGPATGRYRYDEFDLQALAERTAAHEETYVIFGGVEMWKDAKRFKALIDG